MEGGLGGAGGPEGGGLGGLEFLEVASWGLSYRRMCFTTYPSIILPNIANLTKLEVTTINLY